MQAFMLSEGAIQVTKGQRQSVVRPTCVAYVLKKWSACKDIPSDVMVALLSLG